MAADNQISTPSAGPIGRIRGFWEGLKSELRQVIWPGWEQVWQTGVVVIFAVIFYGVFLHAADLIMHFLLTNIIEMPLRAWVGH
jgi:preprotein translocase SecE subunit